MRLAMFDCMDATAALLEKRRDFYRACAYELQELIAKTLSGEALLSVNARVKKEVSLREKILRKRLYLEYDNPYDLLGSLSDLIGIRAECRFLREEAYLFEALCESCTQRHDDGYFSIPTHPNIRFDLSVLQPQTQQNGLSIYRIDGKYHKNGVTAPFELQIKALVHVFWAEVEHQLIYKNNSYIMMDGFLKKLLYSNYDSLQQIDSHLQLLYDQMRVPSPTIQASKYANIRPALSKTLSDLFLERMHEQMHFSVRMDGICDILTQYLLTRTIDTDNPIGAPIGALFERIRKAAQEPLIFDEALDLGGAIDVDDPFCSKLGCHLAQQINADYEWNLFFRLLFTLEEGDNLEIFSSFILLYEERFASDALYQALPQQERAAIKETVLLNLSEVMVQHDGISMFQEETIVELENAIRRICEKHVTDGGAIKRLLLNAIEAQ